MEVAGMRILWWMSGVTRKDEIWSDCIKGNVKVGPVAEKFHKVGSFSTGTFRENGKVMMGKVLENWKL